MDFLGTRKASIEESAGDVIITYQFAGNITPSVLTAYRTHLLTDFKFGSGYLYNVYYLQKDSTEGHEGKD